MILLCYNYFLHFLLYMFIVTVNTIMLHIIIQKKKKKVLGMYIYIKLLLNYRVVTSVQHCYIYSCIVN